MTRINFSSLLNELTSSSDSGQHANSHCATRNTMRNPSLFALLLSLSAITNTSLANTSSVFSPDVSADSRQFEYRASFEPGKDGDEDVFGHRLHYQQSINQRMRWRLIGFQSDTGEDLEFRYARGEFQYQLHEDEDAGFDSAVRLELQIAEGDDLPSRARIGWTGKIDAAQQWQLRANVLAGRQFDSGAKSGILLETRWQASYKLANGMRVGLEMFNDLNTTTNFGNFDSQEHSLGPILKFGLGQGWKAEASYHAGLSDAASDHTYRLHIKYDI